MAGLAFPIRVAARYAAVGVTPFLTGPRDKLSYYEKQMAASPTEPLGEFLSTALRAGGLEGRGPDVAQFLERAIPAASRLYLGRPWVQLSATSEVHSLGMAVFNDASTVSAAFHEYGRELGLDPGALEIARMFAAAMPRSAYGQLRAEVRSGEPTRASVYFGWLLNPLRGHGGFDRLLSNLPPAFRSSSVADNAARLAERCRPDLYPYGVGLSFVPGQVEPEVKLYVTRYDERRSPLRGSGSLHALLATLELPAQELARVHDLHDRLWESAATKAIQVAISVSPQRRPADRISLIYCGARIDEAQKALTGDGITDTTPLNVLHTSFGSERAMYLGINVGPRGLSRRMKVYEAGFFRNTDLAALRRGRATGEQATSGVPPAPRPSRGQAPGPRKRQTPGVLARLVRSPFDEMQSLRERYGDVVALPDLGSAKTCFVFGPDGVERMFRDNSKNYVRGANFRGVSKVVGNGIVASEGEFWRRQRKQVQPALSKGVVATQVESMVAIIAATLDAWEERADSGDWVDIAHQMRLVTRKITLKVMLGIDEENEANDISRSWEEVYDALTYFTTRPWQLPTRVPTPRNRAFKTAMAALDQRIYEKIAEHQRDPEAAGDLVRALLAARDPISGRPMTQRQLRDELVTVSSAGFDTAAVTLAWTAYLLSQHPWAAHRVAAEADEVFGDRLPTVEDLPKLKFTDRVVRESMRCYPAAWVLTRTCVDDDEIGGYRVQAGTMMVTSAYVTHRHPAHWPNPDQFDPDRFTKGRSTGRSRFAFFPFGDGPRKCPGEPFAQAEIIAAIALMSKRFVLRLKRGHPVEMEPSFTLRPRYGLQMRIEKRRETWRSLEYPAGTLESSPSAPESPTGTRESSKVDGRAVQSHVSN